jgi:hypothetical protein
MNAVEVLREIVDLEQAIYDQRVKDSEGKTQYNEIEKLEWRRPLLNAQLELAKEENYPCSEP